MSAYRAAMLSVPPERLEQFSLELKQNIKAKRSKISKDYHKRSKTNRSDKKYRKKEKSSTSGKSTKSKSASSTKRRSAKDKKSHKRHRKSDSEPEILTDESDMEEDGLDLSKELHPLSHYVKDRQALSDILFSIVKGAKLAAMLPDILKDMPLDELKQKCFSHLEVMSSKRIIHTLTGETMQSSSGTDSDDEHNSRSQNNEAVAKEEVAKEHLTPKTDENSLQTNFVDSTTSTGLEVFSLLAAGSEQCDVVSDKKLSLDDSQKSNDKKVVIESSSTNNEESASPTSSEDHPEMIQEDMSDIEEEIETVEIVEDVEYADMVDAMLEEPLVPDGKDESAKDTESVENKRPSDAGLSQLELLELQLRARAIKSLMKAAQTSD